MEVKVVNRLAAVGVGVDHEPVASLSNSRLAHKSAPKQDHFAQ
jgi:hypothetical protein